MPQHGYFLGARVLKGTVRYYKVVFARGSCAAFSKKANFNKITKLGKFRRIRCTLLQADAALSVEYGFRQQATETFRHFAQRSHSLQSQPVQAETACPVPLIQSYLAFRWAFYAGMQIKRFPYESLSGLL